jgi:hypothetical protein
MSESLNYLKDPVTPAFSLVDHDTASEFPSKERRTGELRAI